ncbi:MAG: hypothetical protein ACRDPA_20550 [Solirubrobacteraceae bacterium]
MVDTAIAVADGTLDLEALAQLDDRAAVERLTRPSDVGRWTAEYVMLRGLGCLHVFPGDDVGAQNTLKRFLGTSTRSDYERVRALLARRQPYAGVMYFHLVLDSLSEAALVTAAQPEWQVEPGHGRPERA